MLLWNDIMGGYNTPDAMVEENTSVKVGHEMSVDHA